MTFKSDAPVTAFVRNLAQGIPAGNETELIFRYLQESRMVRQYIHPASGLLVTTLLAAAPHLAA